REILFAAAGRLPAAKHPAATAVAHVAMDRSLARRGYRRRRRRRAVRRARSVSSREDCREARGGAARPQSLAGRFGRARAARLRRFVVLALIRAGSIPWTVP